MRKINNKTDFIAFIDDVRDNTRLSPLASDDVYFGLSQDGDNVDGVARAYKQDFGVGYIIPHLVFDNGSSGCDLADEFIDGVEGNYNYPFYIVDTGANYNWL